MLTIGIDAHKRSHTAVIVDEQRRQLAQTTSSGTTSGDHLALLGWAAATAPAGSNVTCSRPANGSSGCPRN